MSIIEVDKVAAQSSLISRRARYKPELKRGPEQTQESVQSHPRLSKVVLVAALGSFVAQLNVTVVNVSLSNLAIDLHSSLPVIQWVTSGYLLALALMLPLNGWLVERIGLKRLYVICFSGFTCSSLLCALSWSANSLIAFRVLQGMSGGLMAPMAQLMIARTAGKHFMRVVGYVAVPVLPGPIVGPVIAGTILQHMSWRWLFLINLPIGMLAVALTVLFLPIEVDMPTVIREFDLTGFLLLSPGLVLFLYGSDHLRQGAGIAALLISILLLAAFLRKAWKKREHALIDLQLFRTRVFSASAVTQFTTNGLLVAGQMLIPVYLIRAAGESPGSIGWLMAPLGLGMMCTYRWLRKLTQHFGVRETSAGGALIAFLGTLPLLYLSSQHFNLSILAISQFVRGIGMSAASTPSISAAYASVRKGELPMATTSLNIMQRLGGPALTTVCATFLWWRLMATPLHASVSNAFTVSFALLCVLHALLILAAAALPLTKSLNEFEHF
jgi:EmrB/QacA subfamily drug resistance transporter